MTLFVPNRGNGFVSSADGRVTLRRVLIPVDHVPPADTAIQKPGG
jgi:hypothetical protein